MDPGVGPRLDGRAIFVQSRAGVPARVERIDPETGVRTLVPELSPPDPAGITVVRPIQLSADGRSCVYSYKRRLSVLCILDGANQEDPYTPIDSTGVAL